MLEPDPRPHPAWRRWSSAWPYLLAVAIAGAAWIAIAADLMLSPLTAAQRDVAGAVLVLDLVVGLAVLAALPLRHRHPLVVACLTCAAAAVSVSSIGAAAVAVVAVARRRRRDRVAVTVAVSFAGELAHTLLYRPWFAPSAVNASAVLAMVAFWLVFVAAAVSTGYYLGARQELVASLHVRVLTAERQQAATATAARLAERTMIAREMHDVLAHRISLVALHAGALAYRGDLSRTETAATAQTIRDNAHLALAELRQVLGVLRSGPAADGVEPPQPTLTEVPALLADAREAGCVVRFDSAGLRGDLAQVAELPSRTSFRIVQESLTNARRHAPGEPVDVRLAGVPGGQLELEISNPAAPGRVTSAGGVGLVGLTERAELAGGTLTHTVRPDGTFVVRAGLPWPA
jgi:signal transduction histidine kinase